MTHHIPVLDKKVLLAFENRTLRHVLDGTIGLAGHAGLILKAHPEIQTYVGLDRDPKALEFAKEKLPEKAELKRADFSEMKELFSPGTFDAILLDIGVSSMQLDTPARGFSFSKEGPLDMRMDPDQDLTAEEIVNSWPEKELARIFKEWGEEKKWRQAAKAIVEARRKKPIKTTLQLVEVVKPVLGKGWKIHPATLVFQAIRIAVNREIAVLQETLPHAIELLAPGGRLAVISFHSLEDRVVKNIFRDAAKEKRVVLITKKPWTADWDEVRGNPRARSAKLRVVQRCP